MNSRRIVKFFGGKVDAYGMPELYYSYVIFESDAPWSGGTVASIMPMSLGAPMPDQVHFPAPKGQPEEATMAAINALLSHPELKGLGNDA